MAYKVQKPCKVCGKMYTPCSDCEKDKTVFRWRTVACSEECGKKYFQMVMEARNKNNSSEIQKEKSKIIEKELENEDATSNVYETEKPKKMLKRAYKLENKEESEQIE